MTGVGLLKFPTHRFLTHEQRKELKRAFLGRFQSHNLRNLAIAFETDKDGNAYDGHHYAKPYQHHFAPVRKKKLNILEIGIGGYDDPRGGGQSLRMWRAFFPNSNIYGIDIYDKSSMDSRRIKTFQGSQIDEPFLRRVVNEIGVVDIVIDDGSHLSQHVITTFQILFPLLAPDGIYAIEDLQTSYWDQLDGSEWGGSRDLQAHWTSMGFLKQLVDGLNHAEFLEKGYIPSYSDLHVSSMHFYHNQVFVYKGLNDQLSNFTGLH